MFNNCFSYDFETSTICSSRKSGDNKVQITVNLEKTKAESKILEPCIKSFYRL